MLMVIGGEEIEILNEHGIYSRITLILLQIKQACRNGTAVTVFLTVAEILKIVPRYRMQEGSKMVNLIKLQLEGSYTIHKRDIQAIRRRFYILLK